ncbi:MAG TPA: hypothetical protein PLE45_02220 [Spirochaetota bacterium]|nr:hypothetical protein [Spirochaetota bacterium]HOL55973.1 hypothetical protein [Spirochaetota bacterium]HPP03587.1 hypothetical protein [Spirochaetota bacterium]
MGYSCLKCEYLSKRPGIGNYFIWKCNYWGLICKEILPQYIVASSIGRKCPFFKEKIIKNQKSNNNTTQENNGNIDIIC